MIACDKSSGKVSCYYSHLCRTDECLHQFGLNKVFVELIQLVELAGEKVLDTIDGPVLYKTPCARERSVRKFLMTIKPTVEHIAKWQPNGTTPSVINVPMCASRLTSSASYVGRLEQEAFLDRRPNKF